jgi:hypothetical protein
MRSRGLTRLSGLSRLDDARLQGKRERATTTPVRPQQRRDPERRWLALAQGEADVTSCLDAALDPGGAPKRSAELR